MTDTATILVADDDEAIRTVLRQALVRAGHEVKTTDTAAGLWKWVEDGLGDVIITDVVMPDESGLDLLPRIAARRPDLPVIVMSAQNTLATAVKATERGAFEYLPKPFDINELKGVVQSAIERIRSGRATARREAEQQPEDELPMIGRSAVMQEVYRTMARVIPTDLTVMILGESGTGKELVARALHELGSRRNGPFVAVNMAAIPRELIESELFGHERGAFTGASNRSIGRFEQAQGGTLFLDEIGDMPIDAQTRLLRVLQEGEYTLVGGQKAKRADVRIISATNKDLRKLIEAGRFREDLYYRLNVVPVRLPPLRLRADDIPELARHFLDMAHREGLPLRTLDKSAVDWLRQYSWPGNVRELENLMRRLAALARDDVITAGAIEVELKESLAEPEQFQSVPQAGQGLAESVEQHLARYFATFGQDLPPDGLYDRIIQEVERPLLLMSLAATRGNQIRAAKLLGLNRNTLRKKLSDLGINAATLKRVR
ncbi:nitrogen regulation protein NR(I) [Pedomonas mirosovicensis]|uniref:nitrogen regulation protein NR(I) n=1 Tax=Pedomonas mirosovicensis TaxID=2908641 RepID=UPI002169B82D|nr:nitrogen regulation protein NR(I) [Pedomonas mirosovicensis]MCH8685256.1 nitrogen regulation protein NR(I) [Pedomonas mirosovicensis]